MAVRFGSQNSPLGGVRFGSQDYAPLWPAGIMAATETGQDTAAAIGWRPNPAYTYAQFSINPATVQTGADSLGSALGGTPEPGDQVLLPISGIGAFEWETDDAGNATLRLARLTGASDLTNVPWYYWNGAVWIPGLFNTSTAVTGSLTASEVGRDTFAADGGGVYGAMAAAETSADSIAASGGVLVSGVAAALEFGSDSMAAPGRVRVFGAVVALEVGRDAFEAVGAADISGAMDATEQPDSFAAAGVVAVAGDLAAHEAGQDAFAASAAAPIAGDLAATETGADTVAGLGKLLIAGTMATADSGGDAFSATGSFEHSGHFSAVEVGSDEADMAGQLAIAGAMVATDAADTFRAIGGASIDAAMAATEIGADRFVATGIGGDLPPVDDFVGRIVIRSATSRRVVKSRRQAAAA